MSVYVTSDTFFGRKLTAINAGYSSAEELEDVIIENWNSKVKSTDIVYHLGNFAWDPISSEAALASLNGKIYFIGGMYDKHISENSLIKLGKHLLMPPIIEIPKLNAVFSHWPLSDWANREGGSLHFHGGSKIEGEERRFCANSANWNWSPIELDFIKEMLEYKNC